MTKMPLTTLLVLSALLAAVPTEAPAQARAGSRIVLLADPKGDDRGPGTYLYPTDPVYLPGSFDLVAFEMIDEGETLDFRATVNQKVGDPWKSTEWPGGGNGFSLQLIHVYIDMDHKPGSGSVVGLPGLNVAFDSASAWDKVVILSPNSRGRLMAEAKFKARDLVGRIVVPQKTWSEGSTIACRVSKGLIGEPSPAWGFQVVVHSNEGYAGEKEFLARKVDRAVGPHRFGGGDDGDCDPHVIDILVTPASGSDIEVMGQQATLGGYVCGHGSGEDRLAILPIVYPQ